MAERVTVSEGRLLSEKSQTRLGLASIGVPTAAAYTPSNVTADRSFDANATTTDELADVVGTLIADLQAAGLLG